MRATSSLANVFRIIAMFSTIAVVVLALPYLLLVGLEILLGGSGTAGSYTYLLLLMGALVGMVVAWWREALGAGIGLGCVLGSLALSGSTLPGVGSKQGTSLLVGPINMLLALHRRGYNPDRSPNAGMVAGVSWILLLLPLVLILASWWLGIRRRDPVSRAGD